MNMQLLTDFFFWCSVINGALLALWVVLMMLAPDLVYKTQYRWFPLGREAFAETMYRFLGLFKILYLMFNLVPWIALKILASGLA
ncbi:hypothetical protein AB833_01605 [Chromatiales bacterium (ex Bugula neritina AB1)]|nr:hypothetical protein AB833_01605 [Chromatiales bacterium (ex Bugula neritina AB1)]